MENKEKYGLSPEYLKQLKLPKASNIEIYDIGNIVKGKKKFTVPEKLEHIEHLKNTLIERLNFVRGGGKIANWQNIKYCDFIK